MPSICSECGRRIDNPYKIDGKIYCYDCFQKIYQEKEKLDKQKQSLYQYICSLFQVNELPGELIGSIDRLIKSGKKVPAMQVTLQYFYEIEGHPRTSLANVGYVIENNYEAAKKYVEEVKRIKEQNEKVDLNVPGVTIKLSPNKIKRSPHAHHKATKIEEL